MGTDTNRIERRLAEQVQALHERLESVANRRKELEVRVNRLRGKLRSEESRLEREREREASLETAFKMAVLAKNLAAGGRLGQHEVSAFLEADEANWESMTIAQACRRILQANLNQPMSNKQLREAILAKGKDVPAGSIPTTLERYPDTFRKDRRGNVTYWSLVDARHRHDEEAPTDKASDRSTG